MPSKLVTKKLNFSVGTLAAAAPLAPAAAEVPPLAAAGALLPAAPPDAPAAGLVGRVAVPPEADSPAALAGLPALVLELFIAIAAALAAMLVPLLAAELVVVLGLAVPAAAPLCDDCRPCSGSWSVSRTALPPQAAAHNTKPIPYKQLEVLIDNLARQYSFATPVLQLDVTRDALVGVRVPMT